MTQYITWRNKVIAVITIIVIHIFVVSPLCFANPGSISLNFIQEDIRIVLHTLSLLSGVNMIIDESAAKDSPTITVRMENVSLDTAIDLIAQAKGLTYHKVDNTIIFERADVADSAVIKLQYVTAPDMKDTITSAAEGLKVKVETDIPSNSLLVTGSSLGISRIKQIVGELDKRLQQVELEAKVVAISKSATKDLGISWTWDETPKSVEYDPPTYSYDSDTGKYVMTDQGTITRHASSSVGGGYPGIIQFGSSPINGLPYEFYYSAKINALVSKGNAKILSQPKVITVNGKQARILIGDRIPVQTNTVANGTTSTSTTYIDTGIKLTYTPVVGADGQITANVRTEVSTPQLVSDIKQYQITTREAETNVRMKDGETMVIGGLIGSQESKTITKVPFLGDLPILGSLFKSVSNTGSESEIVIFLTAHVLQ
ncbi:secretin N-terminal domain-containing protein [Propionispora vibrioides]|uniref:Type IV pilus assembly protein PilQ n=1 Tax=Propionispora vibrioides TaxID=112903 RepID=A0A1H8P0N1_9FIRM|nr:secretin N-terminal domain-containing protein [Propionispora vibrioides]SEO35374.1 type IV pilus assembly protein PilQ [Propionispora vibrioides]